MKLICPKCQIFRKYTQPKKSWVELKIWKMSWIFYQLFEKEFNSNSTHKKWVNSRVATLSTQLVQSLAWSDIVSLFEISDQYSNQAWHLSSDPVLDKVLDLVTGPGVRLSAWLRSQTSTVIRPDHWARIWFWIRSWISEQGLEWECELGWDLRPAQLSGLTSELWSGFG